MKAATDKREQSHNLRAQADAISATLPSILIQAKRIAASVTLGSHGRRRAGVGDSFWQFRPYSKDDSPQAIDFRTIGHGVAWRSGRRQLGRRLDTSRTNRLPATSSTFRVKTA